MRESEMSFYVIACETMFLIVMYPYFRFKLLSVIVTNLCLGNDFIFKRISLSVMVSCFKSSIVL